MVIRGNRPPVFPIPILKGCLWSVTSPSESSSPVMDSGKPQIEEEMSYRSTRVAFSWYRIYHIRVFATWRLTRVFLLHRVPSGHVYPRNLESRFQSTPVPIRRDLEGHPRHVSRHTCRDSRIRLTPNSASDDLENPDKIRTLLKDIREARQAKSRDGIAKLDHSELGVCRPLLLPANSLSYTWIAFWSLFYGDQRDSAVLR